MNSLDPFGNGVLEHEGRSPAGNGHHHVVHRFGDLHQALVVGDAHLLYPGDVIGVNLHGIDLAFEVAHIAKPGVVVYLSRPDDSHNTRAQGCIQLLFKDWHRYLLCNPV